MSDIDTVILNEVRALAETLQAIEKQVAEIGQMVSRQAGDPGVLPDLAPVAAKPIGAVDYNYDEVIVVGHRVIPGSGLIPIRERTGHGLTHVAEIAGFDPDKHSVVVINEFKSLTVPEAKQRAEAKLFELTGEIAA